MSAKKQSITVTQYFNPKFAATLPKDPVDNAQHSFKVEKTVNTLIVSIGQWLTPARVQDLIDSGVDVTIIPVK